MSSATVPQLVPAADAVPLPLSAFGNLPGDRLDELRVELHPSASLVSSRFPVVSAWQAHQDVQSVRSKTVGKESALVVRPELEVEVWPLPAGGFAFLTSLVKGGTVAEAIGCGLEEAPEFDLSANLSVLIASSAVIAFA